MEQPYPVETVIGEAGKFSSKSRERDIELIIRPSLEYFVTIEICLAVTCKV